MSRRILPMVYALFTFILAFQVTARELTASAAAHWDFNEGKGRILHDRSGNGNHGSIHGASWVKSGTGWALQLDGVNDYVDCGNGTSLDLTGPLTLQAWIMPTAANRGEPGIAGKFFESYALTYYGNAYFYISSGGNNISGSSKLREWRHIAGTFDGKTMRFFVNGVEVGSRKSKYDEVKRGGHFLIGCIVGDAASSDPNLQNTAFFPGLVDDIRLHDRALSAAEIAECYNDEATNKGCEPFDVSKFGRLLLEPFFYPDQQLAIASVDFRWVLPLSKDVRAVAELVQVGVVRPLQTHILNPAAARHEDEAAFSLAGLTPGLYELSAQLRRPDHMIQARKATRKSARVTAYADGWQEGTVNLFGGWAEYDFNLPPGEYEIAVRACRIHDAAGIRCTVDGILVGQLNLNGSASGGLAAWTKAAWETIGTATLAPGRHTLRVEATQVMVPGKPKPFATNVYLDAIALSALASDAAGNDAVQKVTFRYPFPKLAPIPAPEGQISAPLPPRIVPPKYKVKLTATGGLLVTVGKRSFRVESCYSYPDGGSNYLDTDGSSPAGEPEWKVKHRDRFGRTRGVHATGRFYEIDRTIHIQASRIVVRDTIRNLWDDVLGVIVSNRIKFRDKAGVSVTQMSNPSIFAAVDGVGLGLIALDDLYQLRQRTAWSDGIAEIRDEHFGLAPGAEHTVEWAIYPTATTDYYDFVNQVRTDEGLNGHVAGAFAFVGRREAPKPEFVAMHSLAYSSAGCLGKPLDNPATPLEGFEFVEYPKECAALKATFAQTKSRFPDLKVMFHVAHGLYICNNPVQRFGDSRAIDQNGRQMHYGPNSFDYYGKYISKEMFDNDWRWWIFYPTLENSFGKAMLAATEYMVRDMGATGMWADGYISGYVKGGYTYDRWDKHSVTIDPDTKRVMRRKTCAAYAALPVLKQCARIISEAGGILISNGQPGPRSYWREETITSCETGGGDGRPVGGLHFGRTVTPLGNPLAIRNERDCYRDMLTKLDLGALFFWYGWRGELTHKTLVEHMYPITFESIHAGVVRGKERIVTKKSGVYGWPEQRGNDSAPGRDLHAIYLYDARGALTQHGFLTTIDKSGVRTEIKLGKDQAAAIVRIPIGIRTTTPVNARVLQYDECGIRISLHGRGRLRITIRDGEYPVQQAISHTVQLNAIPTKVTADRGNLMVAVTLNGHKELRICPAGVDVQNSGLK